MADELPSGQPPIREGDYRMARIGAAMALTALVFVLAVVDVARTDYEFQPIFLTTLLVAILTLLGIEIADQIRR